MRCYVNATVDHLAMRKQAVLHCKWGPCQPLALDAKSQRLVKRHHQILHAAPLRRYRLRFDAPGNPFSQGQLLGPNDKSASLVHTPCPHPCWACRSTALNRSRSQCGRPIGVWHAQSVEGTASRICLPSPCRLLCYEFMQSATGKSPSQLSADPRLGHTMRAHEIGQAFAYGRRFR